MKTIFKLTVWGFIFWCCGSFYMYKQKNYHFIQNDVPRQSSIYSLHMPTNLTGSFCLGFGTIGGTTYYTYFRKVGHSSFVYEKVEADRCIIHEGANMPYIVEYGSKGFNVVNGDTVEDEYAFRRNDYGGKGHEIYVPVGWVTERIGELPK